MASFLLRRPVMTQRLLHSECCQSICVSECLHAQCLMRASVVVELDLVAEYADRVVLAFRSSSDGRIALSTCG